MGGEDSKAGHPKQAAAKSQPGRRRCPAASDAKQNPGGSPGAGWLGGSPPRGGGHSVPERGRLLSRCVLAHEPSGAPFPLKTTQRRREGSARQASSRPARPLSAEGRPERRRGGDYPRLGSVPPAWLWLPKRVGCPALGHGPGPAGKEEEEAATAAETRSGEKRGSAASGLSAGPGLGSGRRRGLRGWRGGRGRKGRRRWRWVCPPSPPPPRMTLLSHGGRIPTLRN